MCRDDLRKGKRKGGDERQINSKFTKRKTRHVTVTSRVRHCDPSAMTTTATSSSTGDPFLRHFLLSFIILAKVLPSSRILHDCLYIAINCTRTV